MSDKWDLLKGQYQSNSEHLMDYVMDKIRLYRDLRLTFTNTRDHVLEGVFARELAMYALAKVHACEEELISDMLDWQRLSDRRNIYFGRDGPQSVKQNTSTSMGKPDKMKTPAKESTITTLQPRFDKIKTFNSVGPKCFNCNGYGHISHDCPKPKRPLKCSKCGADGHTRRKCATDTETIPRVHQVQTLGKVSSLSSYVKTIFINDNKLQKLIDTGCSVCLIRVSSAEQSSIKWQPTVQPLFVVGDIHTPGTATIGQAMADIRIGKVQTKNDQILVVPDKSIPTDMLIGRDWLDLPSVSYYKGKDELLIVPTVADPRLTEELPNREEGLDINNMNMYLLDGSQYALLGWHTNQVTGERITSNHEQCI